ncbi:MAG: hypothetical protein V8S69_00475 [Dakarella massiliensis]
MPYRNAKALYEKLASGTEGESSRPSRSRSISVRRWIPRSIVNGRATRGGPQPTELTRLFREAEERDPSGF